MPSDREASGGSEASDALSASGEVGARSELLIDFFRRRWRVLKRGRSFFRRRWRVLTRGEPLKWLEHLMEFRTSDRWDLTRSELLKK